MLTEPWKRKTRVEIGIRFRGLHRTVSQVTGCADELRNVLLEPVGRYHSAMYGANQFVPAPRAQRGPGTTKAAVRWCRMAAGMP